LLDVLGDLVPGPALTVGGAHVVVNLVEVQLRQVGAPVGHRLLTEDLQGPQADLGHPFGLLLQPGDLLDDLLIETLAGLEHVIGGIAETPPLLVIGVKVLKLAGHAPPHPGVSLGRSLECVLICIPSSHRRRPACNSVPAYYTLRQEPRAEAGAYPGRSLPAAESLLASTRTPGGNLAGRVRSG